MFTISLLDLLYKTHTYIHIIYTFYNAHVHSYVCIYAYKRIMFSNYCQLVRTMYLHSFLFYCLGKLAEHFDLVSMQEIIRIKEALGHPRAKAGPINIQPLIVSGVLSGPFDGRAILEAHPQFASAPSPSPSIST